MQATAGFLPGAKGAGGDISAYALCGPAVVRPFPIMNHAGAVGGEVRDPAARHEGIKQLVSTVFDEMRAVNVHHTGATFAGGPNIRGALGDALLVVGRERTRFAGRIN